MINTFPCHKCPRSDLKNLNYFYSSSFFGDFCLKFFGSRVIEKKSKKTDEKGRVRAGILSLLLASALDFLKTFYTFLSPFYLH